MMSARTHIIAPASSVWWLQPLQPLALHGLNMAAKVSDIISSHSYLWGKNRGPSPHSFFFFFNLLIYLFIHGCVGSSFLCEGFL